MFKYLKGISLGRNAWLLMFLITSLLHLSALFMQHVLDMQPCVLCIYQRTALLGVWFAALIGLIAPQRLFMRLMALSLWLYSAIFGALYSWQHVKLQFFPNFLDQCDLFPIFYFDLKWDKWMPFFFEAKGLCSERQGVVLGLELSQWMLIVFSVYLLVGLMILGSQIVKIPAKNTMFSFRKRWKN